MAINWFWATAAMASFIVWGLHTFVGGPTSARPLLASVDLNDVAKHTNYYCWHIVTIVLMAMSIGFGLSASHWASRDLAILMTFLSISFSIWSGLLVIWKRQKPFLLPQWALFIPIAVLGALGIWA